MSHNAFLKLVTQVWLCAGGSSVCAALRAACAGDLCRMQQVPLQALPEQRISDAFPRHVPHTFVRSQIQSLAVKAAMLTQVTAGCLAVVMVLTNLDNNRHAQFFTSFSTGNTTDAPRSAALRRR